MPTVKSRSITPYSNADFIDVTLPADISNGDFIGVRIDSLGGAFAGSSLPSQDWIVGASDAEDELWFAYKTADGSEGGTTVRFNFGTSGTKGTYSVIIVENWSNVVFSSITSESFGSSPNPPTVSASGAGDHLFIAYAKANNDDHTWNSAPTNYSNLLSDNSATGSNNTSGGATAERLLTGTSDDPGVFSLSTDEFWTAGTLVLEGVGGESMTFDQGSYSYTFQDVNLPQTYFLGFDQGSYSYAMQTVNLLRNLIIEFEQGTYTYSTNDVTLAENEFMTFEQGSYSRTMQDVGLFQRYYLGFEQGTYNYTMQNVDLLRSLVLTFGQGSFTRTMQDVGLNKRFVLTFDQGSYALTMSGVELLQNFFIAVEQGDYTLTMSDVELLRDMVLRFDQGDYTLTMGDVILTLIAADAVSTEKLTLSSLISTSLSKQSTISTQLPMESPISTTLGKKSTISDKLSLKSTIDMTLELKSEVN